MGRHLQFRSLGPAMALALTSPALPLLSTLLFLVASMAPAQQSEVNLNEYYRYPVAISFTYQPLAGIGNDALTDFTIAEFAGEVRRPLEAMPTIQPLVRMGLINYSFTGDVAAVRQDWTHRHLYAGPGVAYTTRISREFELGADVFGAVSQSYFPELTVDGEQETQGQLNALGGASLRLALNPSYNMSIAVTPSARYLHGLGPLDDYNGFTFGIGVGASYRFGRDPDAAGSEIRAIRFVEAEIPDAFAAMQSYYAQEPLGLVRIENTERAEITDVEVNFLQTGFMDSPTPSGRIEVLAPGETVEIPILASFNDQVFTTQGITPLTGEVIVQYSFRNRPAEQRRSVTYDLHDRNALTWDDDRKVAAFITPQDSAIRNYGSYIRRVHREATNPFVSENLQFAMQAYNALAELGILYQVDPTSPFTQVQEDTFVVDSISLPRETLTRLTGDCDDITVLYNTMLQSVGIETAFVTTPGHIYSAVNTGVASAEYRSVHPDRAMTLDIDGELWVLVEITLIGRAGFLEAWSTGVVEFARYEDNTRARGFYRTGQAQEVFRPVALRETDLGLQYGSETAIAERFERDLDQLAGVILRPYEEAARETGSVRDWNAYGIAAAQFGASRQAREAFTQVLRIDPDYINARLNLGSLAFLDEDYRAALDAFEAAERVVAEGGRIRDSLRTNLLLNLSKTHYALENYDQAREYYETVQQVNADEAMRFSYLGAGGGTGSIGDGDASAATGIASAGEGGDLSGGIGRASSAASAEPILFFGD